MMFRPGIFGSLVGALVLASVLLLHPVMAIAQRHGAGAAASGQGGLSAYSRPDGVNEVDSLKDFHQALAAQATSQQIAGYEALLKSTEAAKAELQATMQRMQANGVAGLAAPHAALDHAALDQALENVRNGNRKFQEGFSDAQKSGLRDVAKRLAKADTDLEQEQKKLNQSLDANAAVPEITAHAESLEKMLSDFSSLQLALGREMSIVLASGQDLAFILPQVKSAISIRNKKVAVMISGVLAQIAVQGEQRRFRLELIADLSDLQQNVTDVLRAGLDASPACGERVALQRATLTPATPASLLVLQLHYERWSCSRMLGQQTSNELAEEDGTVEMKLTPALEQPNTLKMDAVLGRIDASGMMADSLRSGLLGDELREQAARTILSVAQAASDFKIALPPAVRNAATIESTKFLDAGAGYLHVVLDGQVEISNQQADALASQLNQTLSATR